MALALLNSPSTFIISGPSGSGKTEFVYKLITNAKDLFEEPLDKIYYFYGVWQSRFDQIYEGQVVEYFKGLPDYPFLEDLKEENHKLLIIDDQQLEALNSKLVADLFTKFSHHKNITTILILQNLFHQGKYSRDISLNAHYFVLFKNQRDINQIKILGNQLGLSNLLLESYFDATKDPFTYLLIDISPTSNRNFMLRTHIFPQEHATIYK